jgi:uncharacterized protein (DUF885 family)
MRRITLILSSLVATFAGAAMAASPHDTLERLFSTSWQKDLAEDPIAASGLGEHRYDAKLTEVTPAALTRRANESRRRLAALHRIPRAQLDAADQLNYDLFEWDQKLAIDSAGFRPEDYAFRPYDGPQLLGEQLAETLTFATEQDYRNYLARLQGMGRYYDQWIGLLDTAAKRKRTQPRAIVERVLEQIAPQVLSVEANPFFAPFQRLPQSLDAATRARLLAAGHEAVASVVLPAQRRLQKFFRDVYLPASRDSVGIWDTPDGELYYKNRARLHTTTDLTPQQIHELGLAEVARIRTEMQRVIESVGWTGTFAQFLNELRTNPKFYYKTPEELLAAYEATARRIERQIPKLFGRLPKAGFGVRAIPAASAPATTTAYYQPGSLDGARPGNYYVNLYRPEVRPKYEIEVLTSHEAVPGHHLQIALSYEQTGLPEFRRNAGYSAYVEGWALYSEGLGYELGLYTDPYSKFGQLTYDMWRAVRLVVDTGMHVKRWTREQAIEFFKANAAKTEADIINEVDRYISWPGQALAYKVGQLKIRALRAEAEQALGTGFDARAFHDQLLATGALPLAVLEAQTRAWIARQRAKPN